jgi:hypothetical protein
LYVLRGHPALFQLYFDDPNAPSVVKNYAPKLVVIDLATDAILETYVFPSDVAPYNTSFLNDLAIDEVRWCEDDT